MKGTLYCVALPIGNAEDITLRAIRLLKEVDVIACEDTGKLKSTLIRCGIETKARFLAYYSYNEQRSAPGIMKLIDEGKSVALVTDAGTPRVSDPGFQLIKMAYENGVLVEPVPGPAALTAAMSIAPIPLDPLVFFGFITPKKGKRVNFLERYKEIEATFCFYESVHRIDKLLEAILEVWGDLEVFIIRELTKQHQNRFWGKLSESLSWLAREKKGEFVVFVCKNN